MKIKAVLNTEPLKKMVYASLLNLIKFFLQIHSTPIVLLSWVMEIQIK